MFKINTTYNFRLSKNSNIPEEALDEAFAGFMLISIKYLMDNEGWGKKRIEKYIKALETMYKYETKYEEDLVKLIYKILYKYKIDLKNMEKYWLNF